MRKRLIISILSIAALCLPYGAGAMSAVGVVTLSESYYTKKQGDGFLPGPEEQSEVSYSSKRILIEPPAGWQTFEGLHYDILTSPAGANVHNIFISRVHVDNKEGALCLDCAFPPLCSSRHLLVKRFTRNMSPLEASAAMIENLRHNQEIVDLTVQSAEPETINGHACFKAVFEYRRLIGGRRVPYRTVYYGLVLDDWFYGIGYTGTVRYYYGRDVDKFTDMVKSIRFEGK
jgi:hypothetical protein